MARQLLLQHFHTTEALAAARAQAQVKHQELKTELKHAKATTEVLTQAMVHNSERLERLERQDAAYYPSGLDVTYPVYLI